MKPLIRRVIFSAVLVLVAAAAASGGVALWRSMHPAPFSMTPVAVATPSVAPQPASLKVGDRRPDLSLRDTRGMLRSISEWDGKLLFVNFWATWCPPCLEEIPTFVKLQERYQDAGVVFLGIALDSPDRVKAFMTAQGMNYESLHGEKDAIDASRAFGNQYGGLPFTALVARDGRIAHLKQGILEEDEVVRLVEANR